jgi:hypothetical protein
MFFPHLQRQQNFFCAASALVRNGSGCFGEMKGGRDVGYISFTPTGHRNSLCGLHFTNKYFGPLGGNIIPSLPPAREHTCAASALPISTSGLCAEMKSRRDEGLGSRISTGHKTSLCALCFSKK